MNENRSRWLSLILLLFLSGCAGLGNYREGVRVTVSNIEVLETKLLEQLYRITLRIQNRDEQALTITGGSFDLEINGKDFGSGVTDAKVTIASYADAKIDVRMVSTVFGMLRLIQNFQDRQGESLDYEISGRLYIDDAFGGLWFIESGEISLPMRHSSGNGEGI